MAKAEASEQGLLQLFQRVVSEGQWEELEGRERAAQIYSLPVVVWMMVLQRIGERGTQQEAVQQLLTGQLDPLLPAYKRVRAKKISSATGGYSRACGRLSRALIEQVVDDLLAKLKNLIEPTGEAEPVILLLDGTSNRVEHTAELGKRFPPGHNQHGPGHWGVVKWVALHDVHTGIALRPAWGPMYGKDAISEQKLAEEILQRAPAVCIVIGDGNFGIFSFAYAVAESKREGLFRLTKARAEALGAKSIQGSGELQTRWCPSAYERKRHPELPADAHVDGRLVVVRRNGFREPLYLFTTLQEGLEQLVALYAKRWNLELDLRTLKGTMRLEHLHGKSPEAVEKELLIAVLAYGLVRAFMALAAARVDLPPRRLSFTSAYGLINAMMGQLCSPDPQVAQRAFDRTLDYLGKSKLPNRSKPRAYPREVWGSGKYFPRKRDGTTNSLNK
jgi:hypothetical protein